MRFGLALALSAAFAAGAAAQELAPGARYHAEIPTIREVLGHDFGQEITPPEGIAAYLTALAAAAPDRARVVEYARSWQGRPLHLLIVASPARMAALDRVAQGLRRLADPRGLASGEQDRLLRELPVVVWLMHAVHGNEISSSDAALAEAYHLLAAEGDAEVDAILRESIVLIDPLQNPDGRARFVLQNLQGRAALPDPDPLAAERDEPWPGGRTNHYLFDMNRDWFALTQPETHGRLKIALEWVPHVVVDLHEMGGDTTYYFAPPADPLNPHITREQSRWLETFGRANAARFDTRGFAYFIRERFDSFYPGYGESWPIFQGAIGMTYEQASARGLAYRREDGALLTYRTGVVQHFTAALATLATAAANRDRILRDFVEYRRNAITEGTRGPVREYLLSPEGDRSRAARLARLLAAQGIEVRRTEEPVALGSRTLPAGTFAVSAAQPAGRLVRNLLERHVPQPQPFVDEQDRRRRKRLEHQIYDITGWSLPLLYDIEVVPAERAITVRTTPVTAVPPADPATLPAAKVAYVLPWGSGTAALAAEALHDGIRMRQTREAFTIGTRRFAGGAAIVRVAENAPDLPDRLGALAARHDVEVVPLDSGWVDEGVSLGSDRVQPLKVPRVLLAWDEPTYSHSAGWARYVLERRFAQPVTAVRVARLGQVNLSRFDVIVLPQGDYTKAVGEEQVRLLKDWMRRGGTLVTLGEASRWAARPKVRLLETRTELRGGKPEDDPEDAQTAADKDGETPDEQKPEARRRSEEAVPFDLQTALQPERERPENTPGAIVRVALDRDHWLASGHDEEIHAMVHGARVFTPIKLDKGVNVGLYAPRDRLVAAGLVWDDAGDQLAQKAFVIAQPVGKGHLVAFAEDPNFRAFTEATQLLFINAVLLGPAY